MKFSAQEEYALRCLISIGRFYGIKEGLTIPDISKREGISQHTVAKTLRQLRIGGFLDSERGHTGGYALTRMPEEIKIGDVLHSLGGKLYDDEFCQTHSGVNGICSNSTDCSIRSLWRVIQDAVDSVTKGLTLKDLLGTEDDVFARFSFDSENSSTS
ncbi:MAG: Rrf2 family transcriptional regulator [Bacteroidetes bacterium]|nr:Rrf2 family transcriptional regulator [Bacteroidota bacterium]